MVAGVYGNKKCEFRGYTEWIGEGDMVVQEGSEIEA